MNNIFYSDMHMHLDLSKNIEQTIQYIEENKSYTIAVTNLPDLYRINKNKFKNLKYIRFALGFHPELIVEYSNQMNIFKEEIENAHYIGEIGLDKLKKENYEFQKDLFKIIVQECSRFGNKILSIHSRKSVDDILSIIQKDFNCSVIMHWFLGSKKQLKECISRGFYFSINENMVKSQKGREIISEIPKNKILIESDFPFSNQKTDYNIDFVEEIIQYLSNIKNISEQQMSEIIKRNLFEILQKNN